MPKEIEDWRENWLLSMINAMDREVSLEESDKVLILMQLNTADKITAFNEWVKTKLVNGKLETTQIEIMHASAEIGRLTV